MLSKYNRIRRKHTVGRAAVALNGQTCTGCHMTVMPQIVNEVLEGKTHICPFCNRLLYSSEALNAGAAIS